MNLYSPLVSILTPSYNCARFIERCILSVLSQDYPKIEHIIQDSASEDGTIEILKKYTGRVNWLSEPDRGQSDGLNRAIKRCHGDIIGVLNADDEYLPHAVSWAVENFVKYPDMAVIYGDQYDVDIHGYIVHKTYGRDYDFEKIFCVENVIPAQAAFIKRECFEQVGLYADVTRKTCPDYEMWVRIGLKYQMQHVPGFVVKYRWHPESEGRQVNIIKKMIKSKREVIDRVCDNPSTPKNIRKLRRRAHSGAVWWGACSMIETGGITRGLLERFRSLWLYPSIKKAPGLHYFLPDLLRYAPYGRFRRVGWRITAPVIKTGLIILAGLLMIVPLIHYGEKKFGSEFVTYFSVGVLAVSLVLLLYKSVRFIYRRTDVFGGKVKK